ncbi:hypothetical protein [Nostoc sp. MG11]|uniref:hypothetical protein n=1 Tax=Nostoc sp. MG11 TaxID=2721166 RepID=UPI001867B7ED|nr:hypothetical protein [Nostoc sp. MG11]
MSETQATLCLGLGNLYRHLTSQESLSLVHNFFVKGIYKLDNPRTAPNKSQAHTRTLSVTASIVTQAHS